MIKLTRYRNDNDLLNIFQKQINNLSGRWQIVKKEGGWLSESLKAKIMITKYKIPISKVNYSAITSKKTRLHLNILTKIKLLMTGKMLF